MLFEIIRVQILAGRLEMGGPLFLWRAMGRLVRRRWRRFRAARG